MHDIKSTSAPPATDASGVVFLRLPSVVRMTGLGRSTIYRLIAERKFPRPVKLTARAVGWRRSDVERWGQGRPSATH